MSWNHYIEGTEIHPSNMRSAKITEKKEKGQKRIKCPSSLTLIGDDYTYAKTLESDTTKKYSYEVKKDTVLKAQGEFVRNDMDFDDTKEVCTISLNAYDEYTVINEIEEEEVNVLECTPYSVTAELKSYLVFYLGAKSIYWYEVEPIGMGSSTVWNNNSPPDNFKLYYQIGWTIYDLPPGNTRNFVITSFYLYAQERIIVDKDRTLAGWTLLDDSGDFHLYGREFNESIYPLPSTSDIELLIPHIRYPYSTSILTIATSFNEDTTWKTRDCMYYNLNLSTIISLNNIFKLKKSIYRDGEYCGIFTIYNNAIKLKDALNKIIKNKLPDYSVVSTFLFNDVNAPGEPDFYTLYAQYRTNYVSHLLKGEYYIIHKSDFINPLASQSATKGLLDWKTAIDYLTNKFPTLYWHIDGSGNIRIEHGVYYESIPTGIKLENTSKIYSYPKNETPSRQIYEESESWTEMFTKQEIKYDDIPVLYGESENKQEFNLLNFITDIDGANQRLDSLSSDGWVFVEVGDNMYVTKKGTEQIQNLYLSTWYCLHFYAVYQAYRSSLKINDTEYDTYSIIKQKKQTITFESEDNIDVLKDIETDLGAGEFISLEYAPVDSSNGVKYTAEVEYE